MRFSVSTLRASAALIGLTTVLGGMPAAAATVAAAPAAVSGAPVVSLPFYGTGDVTGVGTGTSGTAAANSAVGHACNGGSAIHSPQWYALPAVTMGKVYARVDAPFHPRGIDQNPSGSAFVDMSSGNVVACGARPVDVKSSKRLAVVAYYAQDMGQCMPLDDCALGSLRLYVGSMAAAPRNDRWQHATTIRSLPFAASVDTSAADDDGPAVFDYEHCEMSAINPEQHGTVWWRYTPTKTGPAPALAVDVRTAWNRMGRSDGFDGISPRIAVAELTAAGPVPAPHQVADDCDSPVVLRAGRTYLIAVYVFEDGYEDSTPVTGGPLTLRVGAVGAPRVPQSLSVAVNRTARRATVRWAPPTAALGATAVSGYVVRLDERTATAGWVTRTTTRLPATARSRTLTGLTSSGAYRVRVAAVNRAGGGSSAFAVLSPR
jgi:Fibronectin type III domain